MEVECAGKLLGKRAMHKKVLQKYNIWLGEIKCNVKCLSQALLIFANGHFFCMGGYQGQNSVFPFCCAVFLFCCFVMFCHSLLSDFIVVLFWRNVQLHRGEFGYSRLIKESRSRKKSIAIFAFKTFNGGQKNLGLCEKALPSNCYVGPCF